LIDFHNYDVAPLNQVQRRYGDNTMSDEQKSSLQIFAGQRERANDLMSTLNETTYSTMAMQSLLPMASLLRGILFCNYYTLVMELCNRMG
jgi:hypothetical protein